MALYKRVLLKLSGEALKGNNQDILDRDVMQELSDTVKQLVNKNVQVGIVVGGGNIFRGRIAEQLNLERVNADYVGMTATIINGLMLENVFKINGLKAKTFSMLPIKGVVEKFNKSKANRYLNNDYIVILAGGTGKPYLSTDTAAAIKAQEINAEIILAGKNGVDGVYDDDPSKNPKAKLYKEMSYQEFVNKDLKAFDIEGIKICQKNNIKIRVFNMNKLSNISKVVDDEKLGTIIK